MGNLFNNNMDINLLNKINTHRISTHNLSSINITIKIEQKVQKLKIDSKLLFRNFN